LLALEKGIIDAYCGDGTHLGGLKAKAPKPDDYKIVGEMLTYDPYAFIVRQNDSAFLDFVNAQIIEMIKDGRYMTIYEKWFGPKGALPMPMTDEFKTLLKLQAWPS